MSQRPGYPLLLGLALTSFSLAACSEDAPEAPPARTAKDLAGSSSCRSCHSRFYELWSTSHHGTAMQPFTAALARASLVPPGGDVKAGGRAYAVEWDDSGGRVRERSKEGDRVYPMAHAMGGKNVYFFLTPLDRGRLQVLPVAYDVPTKTWYDTTASMVRHVVGPGQGPVEWTDSLLTFNTSCWNCHVSQLSVNYDAATDAYDSRWAEPGINCETCHGPAGEHVRSFRAAAAAGEAPPRALGLIAWRGLATEQRTDACAPCHAKAILVADRFEPGARYFDHFDVAGLEDPDFYPDGRDLGENYTFTGWRMSPCASSGRLDCVHCHTSSGRYRFAGERTNEACLPCHEERVANSTAHTRHKKGGPGDRCVDCHMPMTAFARMRRSDHSMRAPSPAATTAFGSPNACNLCHADKNAAWADGLVRAWHARDYQAPILRRGAAVAAARARDWRRLDAILEEISRKDRDEVTAASLLRLLAPCGDPRKVPVILGATKDPSPLVRASAVAALDGLDREPGVARALLDACGDDTRLVRVRAAGALAGIPAGDLEEPERARLARATQEQQASLALRPDHWSAPFNRGNDRQRRGDLEGAIADFEKAGRMRPDAEAPWVNAAMAHAVLQRPERAEAALRRALEANSGSAPAHFNLGLLLAERGAKADAVAHLKAALQADPTLAAAAYNLAVLLFPDDAAGGLSWAAKATNLAPDVPRYAYTEAFFLAKSGRGDEARTVLSRAVERGAADADVYGLLGRLHEEKGDLAAARAVYRRAADDARLDDAARRAFRGRAGP